MTRTFSFTVTATDTLSVTGSRAYTINIGFVLSPTTLHELDDQRHRNIAKKSPPRADRPPILTLLYQVLCLRV